jgi:hypothetical protein
MAKLEVRLVLRCDGVEVIYTHKELGGRSVQIDQEAVEAARLHVDAAEAHLRDCEDATHKAEQDAQS